MTFFPMTAYNMHIAFFKEKLFVKFDHPCSQSNQIHFIWGGKYELPAQVIHQTGT
jgi:hypothetical protein